MPQGRAVAAHLAELLAAEGLEHERPEPNRFVIVLPGRDKLRTTVSMTIGPQALVINAFVARRPDENAEGVYRWLLQQNTRLLGIGFALDSLGDIYLVGRIPVSGLGPDDLEPMLLRSQTQEAPSEMFAEPIHMLSRHGGWIFETGDDPSAAVDLLRETLDELVKA